MINQAPFAVTLLCGLLVATTTNGAEPAASKVPEPLPIQGVTHIAELPDGTTAFGSQSGLALWRDGKLATFTGPQAPPCPKFAGRPAPDLPSDHVWCLSTARDGRLWVGLLGGLARVTDGKVEDLTPRLRSVLDEGATSEQRGIDVMSLLAASDGRILIGMRYANLVVYTPRADKFEKISLAPEIDLEKPPHANNWVRCIAEDRNKGLWATIGDLGLFQIEGRLIKDPPGRYASWNKTDDPRVLYFDSRGDLWIGTTDGIDRYRPNGARSTLTEEDGLPGNLVEEIHEFAPGGIWIKTDGGVCVYDGKTFRYPALDPSDDGFGGYAPPEALFRSRDGKYWAANWSQVTCTKNVAWVSTSPFERAVAAIKKEIEAEYPEIAADPWRTTDGRGRVWTAVMDRLLRFDGKEWKQLPDANPRRPTINAVKADSQGRVLVCSSGGLLIYEGDDGMVIGDVGTAAGHFYDIAESADGTI